MKMMHRFFFAALIVGALALLGCGDSGETAGGSADNILDACNVGSCATNSDFKFICETSLSSCIEDFPDINANDCIPAATTVCRVTPGF